MLWQSVLGQFVLYAFARSIDLVSYQAATGGRDGLCGTSHGVGESASEWETADASLVCDDHPNDLY